MLKCIIRKRISIILLLLLSINVSFVIVDSLSFSSSLSSSLTTTIRRSSFTKSSSSFFIRNKHSSLESPSSSRTKKSLHGWVRDSSGEYEWKDDDNNDNYKDNDDNDEVIFDSSTTSTLTTTTTIPTKAIKIPTLPSGAFKPKQSLGQNFLVDGNTVVKIIKAFIMDSNDANYGAAVAAAADDATRMGDVATLDDATIPSHERGIVNKIMNTVNNNKDTMILRAVELGPGTGALTDSLVPAVLGDDDTTTTTTTTAANNNKDINNNTLQCIEIDSRSIEILQSKHSSRCSSNDMKILHQDVLQVEYTTLAKRIGGPINIVGNLPYYITSQILFAFCDACHSSYYVRSATVTMQYEVAQRIVGDISTKDYGVLSVVFQLYALSNNDFLNIIDSKKNKKMKQYQHSSPKLHFKIPPTVFYPIPKVDSALIGLRFIGPRLLKMRLGPVRPKELRLILNQSFGQRRKTLGKSLKKLMNDLVVLSIHHDDNENDVDSSATTNNLTRNDIIARHTLDGTLNASLLQPSTTSINNDYQFESQRYLPKGWNKMRPEELTSAQFVELVRIIYHPTVGYYRIDGDIEDDVNVEDDDKLFEWLGRKVWRKRKHGAMDEDDDEGDNEE